MIWTFNLPRSGPIFPFRCNIPSTSLLHSTNYNDHMLDKDKDVLFVELWKEKRIIKKALEKERETTRNEYKLKLRLIKITVLSWGYSLVLLDRVLSRDGDEIIHKVWIDGIEHTYFKISNIASKNNNNNHIITITVVFLSSFPVVCLLFYLNSW